MSAVFQALPGQAVPVAEINARLANLWRDAADLGRPAPERGEARASQINLVVHFGFGTTPEDALAQFRFVSSFAARHPSRVVVLCPHDPAAPAHEMGAKIYGECFLGRTPADARCCEFVLLSYPFAARRFLVDQVSICLSPDLPLYYWAHRFTECRRMADYHDLLALARRFVFDSAAAPAEAVEYPWPKPHHVRDLAHARILPIRQALGQFLARHEPAAIVSGLQEIVVTHGPAHAAEGNALVRWLEGRLVACGAAPNLPHLTVAGREADSIELRLRYANRSHFLWSGHLDHGTACLSADLGGVVSRLTTPIRLLPPEAALADALFF